MFCTYVCVCVCVLVCVVCVYVFCSGRQADVWQYSDVQSCCLPMTQGESTCTPTLTRTHSWALVPSPTGPNWPSLLSTALLFSTSDKKRKNSVCVCVCVCVCSKASRWHLKKSLESFMSSHALTHLSLAEERTPFLGFTQVQNISHTQTHTHTHTHTYTHRLKEKKNMEKVSFFSFFSHPSQAHAAQPWLCFPQTTYQE